MDDLFDNDNDNIIGGGGGVIDPYDPNPYEPDPNPLIPETNTVVNKNINITLRFECPECGGRFASWDKHDITHFDSEKQCPFCHTKKGEFGDQTVNRLKEEKQELEERVEELEEKLNAVKEAFD